MSNSLNIIIGGRSYGNACALEKRYKEVAEVFNIRNEGKYSIYVNNDLYNFFIRLFDLETNICYVISVANNSIYDGTFEEILTAFEELRDSIDKETNTIVLRIKGVSRDD